VKNTLSIVLATISLIITLASFSQALYFAIKSQNLIGDWHGNLSLDPYWELEESKTTNLQTVQVLGANSNKSNINLNSKSYQAYVLDIYFANHKSPLYGYGQNFVDACRKFGAPGDCTLLPAIAKVETDLCKTGISEQQHNCWGYGGSGTNRILYDNFPEAIDKVTGRIMEGYGRGFFEDANHGALSYCGGHCVNYGNNVEYEKNQIKALMKSYGVNY
jgi:hypothetical protein